MICEDVDQKRLDFAVKCGATHTVLIGRDEKEEDVVPRIVKATGGMPDRTIECSGAQFSVNLAVHVNICPIRTLFFLHLGQLLIHVLRSKGVNIFQFC